MQVFSRCPARASSDGDRLSSYNCITRCNEYMGKVSVNGFYFAVCYAYVLAEQLMLSGFFNPAVKYIENGIGTGGKVNTVMV
ncbi:Uncharacterised protein [Mycobacterium tuberculosis]|nr:Uncharacterised protein [Mycobacterium tuberculosis]